MSALDLRVGGQEAPSPSPFHTSLQYILRLNHCQEFLLVVSAPAGVGSAVLTLSDPTSDHTWHCQGRAPVLRYQGPGDAKPRVLHEYSKENAGDLFATPVAAEAQPKIVVCLVQAALQVARHVLARPDQFKALERWAVTVTRWGMTLQWGDVGRPTKPNSSSSSSSSPPGQQLPCPLPWMLAALPLHQARLRGKQPGVELQRLAVLLAAPAAAADSGSSSSKCLKARLEALLASCPLLGQLPLHSARMQQLLDDLDVQEEDHLLAALQELLQLEEVKQHGHTPACVVKERCGSEEAPLVGCSTCVDAYCPEAFPGGAAPPPQQLSSWQCPACKLFEAAQQLRGPAAAAAAGAEQPCQPAPTGSEGKAAAAGCGSGARDMEAGAPASSRGPMRRGQAAVVTSPAGQRRQQQQQVAGVAGSGSSRRKSAPAASDVPEEQGDSARRGRSSTGRGGQGVGKGAGAGPLGTSSRRASDRAAGAAAQQEEAPPSCAQLRAQPSAAAALQQQYGGYHQVEEDAAASPEMLAARSELLAAAVQYLKETGGGIVDARLLRRLCCQLPGLSPLQVVYGRELQGHEERQVEAVGELLLGAGEGGKVRCTHCGDVSASFTGWERHLGHDTGQACRDRCLLLPCCWTPETFAERAKEAWQQHQAGGGAPAQQAGATTAAAKPQQQNTTAAAKPQQQKQKRGQQATEAEGVVEQPQLPLSSSSSKKQQSSKAPASSSGGGGKTPQGSKTLQGSKTPQGSKPQQGSKPPQGSKTLQGSKAAAKEHAAQAAPAVESVQQAASGQAASQAPAAEATSQAGPKRRSSAAAAAPAAAAAALAGAGSAAARRKRGREEVEGGTAPEEPRRTRASLRGAEEEGLASPAAGVEGPAAAGGRSTRGGRSGARVRDPAPPAAAAPQQQQQGQQVETAAASAASDADMEVEAADPVACSKTGDKGSVGSRPASVGGKAAAKGQKRVQQQQQQQDQQGQQGVVGGDQQDTSPPGMPAAEALDPVPADAAVAPEGLSRTQVQQREERPARKRRRTAAAAEGDEQGSSGDEVPMEQQAGQRGRPASSSAAAAAAAVGQAEEVPKGSGSPLIKLQHHHLGKPPPPPPSCAAPPPSSRGKDLAAAVAAAVAAGGAPGASPFSHQFEALAAAGRVDGGTSCQEARRAMHEQLQEAFGNVEELPEDDPALPQHVQEERERLLQIGLQELREGQAAGVGGNILLDARILMRVMKSRGEEVGPLQLLLGHPLTTGAYKRDIKSLGRLLPGCTLVCGHCGKDFDAFISFEEHYVRRSGHVTRNRLLMLDSLWYPTTYARVLQQYWHAEIGYVPPPPPPAPPAGAAGGEGGAAGRATRAGSGAAAEALLPGSLGNGRQLRRAHVAQMEARRRLWWQAVAQKPQQQQGSAARSHLLHSIRQLQPGVLQDFLLACGDAAGPQAVAHLQQLLQVLACGAGGRAPQVVQEGVTAAVAADAEILPLLLCVMLAAGQVVELLDAGQQQELWEQQLLVRQQLRHLLEQQLQQQQEQQQAVPEEAAGAGQPDPAAADGAGHPSLAAEGVEAAGSAAATQQQQHQQEEEAGEETAAGSTAADGMNMQQQQQQQQGNIAGCADAAVESASPAAVEAQVVRGDAGVLSSLVEGQDGPLAPVLGLLLLQTLVAASQQPAPESGDVAEAYLAVTDQVKSGLLVMKAVLGALAPRGLLCPPAPGAHLQQLAGKPGGITLSSAAQLPANSQPTEQGKLEQQQQDTPGQQQGQAAAPTATAAADDVSTQAAPAVAAVQLTAAAAAAEGGGGELPCSGPGATGGGSDVAATPVALVEGQQSAQAQWPAEAGAAQVGAAAEPAAATQDTVPGTGAGDDSAAAAAAAGTGGTADGGAAARSGAAAAPPLPVPDAAAAAGNAPETELQQQQPQQPAQVVNPAEAGVVILQLLFAWAAQLWGVAALVPGSWQPAQDLAAWSAAAAQGPAAAWQWLQQQLATQDGEPGQEEAGGAAEGMEGMEEAALAVKGGSGPEGMDGVAMQAAGFDTLREAGVAAAVAEQPEQAVPSAPLGSMLEGVHPAGGALALDAGGALQDLSGPHEAVPS